MYIEEFYSLVDELDLSEKDVDDLKIIIRRAAYQYLLKMWQNELNEKLVFCIDGWYINQSELLSKLGISVSPKSWKQSHADYGDNPFGPSDNVSWTTTETETSVVFPTKLFKSDKKEDILKIVKKKVL